MLCECPNRTYWVHRKIALVSHNKLKVFIKSDDPRTPINVLLGAICEQCGTDETNAVNMNSMARGLAKQTLDSLVMKVQLVYCHLNYFIIVP